MPDDVGTHEVGRQSVQQRKQKVIGEKEHGRRKHKTQARRHQLAELLGVLEALPVGDIVTGRPSLALFLRARGWLGWTRSVDLHEPSPRGQARAKHGDKGGQIKPTRPPPPRHIWVRPPRPPRTSSMYRFSERLSALAEHVLDHARLRDQMTWRDELADDGPPGFGAQLPRQPLILEQLDHRSAEAFEVVRVVDQQAA